MDLVLTRSDLDRRSLAIARFFAVALFALAAIIALPMALSLVMLVLDGDRRALPIFVGTTPVFGALVWLGRLLWIGRPIPRWFIAAFCGGIILVPAAGLLATGSRMEALGLLGLAAPRLLQAYFDRRQVETKPAAPKEPDDLA